MDVLEIYVENKRNVQSIRDLKKRWETKFDKNKLNTCIKHVFSCYASNLNPNDYSIEKILRIWNRFETGIIDEEMNPQTIQNIHDTQFSLTFFCIESKLNNVQGGKRMFAAIRNLIL